MIIKSCPKCGGRGVFKSEKLPGKAFNIWVQCEKCKARTLHFVGDNPPSGNSQAEKFAVIAWESEYFI